MRFYKKKVKVELMKLENRIRCYYKDRYDAVYHVGTPDLINSCIEGNGYICLHNTFEFNRIDPNVIIYNRHYRDPYLGIEHCENDVLEFIVKTEDNTWRPIIKGAYSELEFGSVFWVLEYIEKDIKHRHKHGGIKNLYTVDVCAINIPLNDQRYLLDLIPGVIIPRLTENNFIEDNVRIKIR